MKKVYETPAVEKIAFQYRDQVVAASGGNNQYIGTLYAEYEGGDCKSEDPIVTPN